MVLDESMEFTNVPDTEEEATVRAAIEQCSELPTIPDVAIKVNQLISNPKSSASDLAKIIASDPALSTKVLRVVNSALYGLRQPVNSTNQAIVILGYKALRELVLGVSIYTALPKGKINHELFWRQSIATAAVCRHLAKRLNLPGDSEIYFTAGLLHEIGMIVLVHHLPEMFEKAIACFEMPQFENISIYEAERHAFGSDHGFIGSVLLEKWGLDQKLIDVLRYYARPMEVPHHGQEMRRILMPALIHVADILARIMLPGPSGRKLPTVSSEGFELLEKLRLNLEELPDILEKSHEEYSAAKVFMGL